MLEIILRMILKKSILTAAAYALGVLGGLVETNLSRLLKGSCAVIDVILNADGQPADEHRTDLDPLARRLLELGFIPGTPLKVLHAAPIFGDPVSYLVRGTHIALRKEEAKRVLVKDCTPGEAT
jgi:ferrous iron transport protein A